MRSFDRVDEDSPSILSAQVGATELLDIDRIRQLVDMMVTNDLVELSLRDGDVEVSLRRPTGNAGDAAAVVVTQPAAQNPTVGAGAPDSSQPASSAEEEDGKMVKIESPMVGTFYAAADADSQPYVRVGSRVNSDTVVCIIEAMKVFNEIKAEVAGTIEKVLVKNEEPIEYGQPLFSVRSE